MIELYGIPNCDTVKKATVWLQQHEQPFTFHNFKKEGVTKTKLKEWCKKFGWETVLNRNGTTWRKLDETQKQEINTEKRAIDFLMENTSAIKRPVLEKESTLFIGFNEATYEQLL